MSKEYDPTDWYFALPDGRVYSTAQRSYVASQNAGLVAWASDGSAPSAAGGVEHVIAIMERVGLHDLAPLNANHVRRECERRIFALMGVSDFKACTVKQLNANMRANQLNDKQARGESLTPQEQATADYLRSLADSIQHLRECSNVMEPNPPADYTDDSHWE